MEFKFKLNSTPFAQFWSTSIWVLLSSLIYSSFVESRSLLGSKLELGFESGLATIYDVLKSQGLPMGLLPKGVSEFSVDHETGKFEVHLDQACYAKFESELHYDRNISGTLSYGKITDLKGVQAQELFLWFNVNSIRVDVPSSGLIYFDVGVVVKQFSLSLFDSPQDCVAVQAPDSRQVSGLKQGYGKLWNNVGNKRYLACCYVKVEKTRNPQWLNQSQILVAYLCTFFNFWITCH